MIVSLKELTNNIDGRNCRGSHLTPNLVSIDTKWRLKWGELGVFNADPDLSRKKYFITVAYPYPNSPQHVGHGRTYTLADAHARYMRMRGYNVLFPMGFHYTGTPILAMSKRVASGDMELIETFVKIHHVSHEDIASFVEPLEIARYRKDYALELVAEGPAHCRRHGFDGFTPRGAAAKAVREKVHCDR